MTLLNLLTRWKSKLENNNKSSASLVLRLSFSIKRFCIAALKEERKLYNILIDRIVYFEYQKVYLNTLF